MASLNSLTALLPATLFAIAVYAAPPESALIREPAEEMTWQDMEQGLSLALRKLEQRGFRLADGAKLVFEATANCPKEASAPCLRFSYTAPSLPHSLSVQELNLTIDAKSGTVFED